MTLLSVGSELPYFGNVRIMRAVANDEVTFDEFLKKDISEASEEAEPLAETLALDFGGGTHLGALAQTLSPSAEPGTGNNVADFLKALEFKFGDISLLNVPNTEEGVESLSVDLPGMGKIIIAENILETMAAFPEKAAYYEGRMRRFAAASLASLPQVQALLTGLGLESVTLSALIVHTDGKIRYLFGGRETSERPQASWRSLLDSMGRDGGEGPGVKGTSAPLSLADVRIQELQGAFPFSEGTQSFVMAGAFMIVSFLEGLPRSRHASPRKNRRQRKRVESVAPRWLKSGQRQK